MDSEDAEILEPLDDSHPAWQEFAQTVAALAAQYDDRAVVTHNVIVTGKASRRPRQIDALVVGKAGFSEVRVVVECKRNTTKNLGIGVVDEFVGKLHDLEAYIGVLCAWDGFGLGAKARAEGATHPRIELRNLADLEALRTWPEVAHTLLRERPCPNPNCLDPDVPLHEWPAGPDEISALAGFCGSCGTLAAECPECGEISAIEVAAGRTAMRVRSSSMRGCGLAKPIRIRSLSCFPLRAPDLARDSARVVNRSCRLARPGQFGRNF